MRPGWRRSAGWKERSTSSGPSGSTETSGRSRRRLCRRPEAPAEAGTLFPMSSALGTFEKALRFGEGRRMKRLVEQAGYIATLEPEFTKLSDDELRGKT